MTKNLDDSLRALQDDIPNKPKKIPGVLGAYFDGKKTVVVESRAGFVWVRLNNNISELVQAFNNTVSPTYDLPVIVEFDGNQYRIISRNTSRYGSMPGNEGPFLPEHGYTHSWANRDIPGIGTDAVWVYSSQFMPFLAFPSGTDYGPTALIGSYLYNWYGQWKYAGGTGTPSFSSYLPTGSNNAKMILLYIEGATGNPKYVDGSEFIGTISGSSAVTPYIPGISPYTGIPIAAIRLVTGTTVLGWDNLYDTRQFFAREQGVSGTVGGGGGNIIMQDEGAFIATGTVLNFVGDGVTATASGTNVRVYIPLLSGTGGGGAHDVVVQDEGAYLVTGTIINFVGVGVTATASGTNVRAYIPGDSHDLVVQDESAYLATGTVLNFVGAGVTATASGTNIRVDIPYGGGGSHDVVLQDEGVYLVTGTVINFVGAGVTATASGTNVRVDIPTGGGSDAHDVTVQDEGSYLVTGTVLNFVGSGVTVTASGTNARIYIPILSGTGGNDVPRLVQMICTGTQIGLLNLESNPVNGHTLLLFTDSTGGQVSDVSSSGTTWTQLVTYTSGGGSYYAIWVGKVGSSASGTITITKPDTFNSVTLLELEDSVTPSLPSHAHGDLSPTNYDIIPAGVITAGRLVVFACGNNNTTYAAQIRPAIPSVGVAAGWATAMMVCKSIGNRVYYMPFLGDSGAYIIAEIT